MARKKKKTSVKQAISSSLVLFLIASYFYHLNIAIVALVSFIIIAIPSIAVLISLYVKDKNLSKSGLREIDKMDGFQFEYYLKALFRQMGYQAKVTQSSHDYGADIVMHGKNKIVIQAKRYNGKVGIEAVQQIIGAKYYYKADEAWVLTNSYFTTNALNLAKACNVKMINRHALQKLILKINPEQNAQSVRESNKTTIKECPTCKNPLVLRKSTYSTFLGCSNYPVCKHTENLSS